MRWNWWPAVNSAGRFFGARVLLRAHRLALTSETNHFKRAVDIELLSYGLIFGFEPVDDVVLVAIDNR